jgi:ABC-type transport system substrate-binding protein
MTDIVGSTEHASELGDSGWRKLVQEHNTRIRAALRRRGGREMDTAGDGFFAIFDAPAAAVACALEIADEIEQLGIEIRAGLHVGEVEQAGAKVTGISVVIAARIMAAAGPGEVLVSATVRDLAAGSRLTFEEWGVQQLKGVPGEWHIYAVSRAAEESVEAGAAADARERRASAVRRAQARPIWQRRPRLVAGAVLGLAAIIAAGGLLVVKPWQPPALASVAENSIGIIDPGRNEVVGAIRVGTQPGGIAVGDNDLWVTDTADGTVSQIDLRAGVVNRIVDVGRAPKGIAIAAGSVWVANSGERTVSRINIATGRVVQTVEVGNGPTAIVAAGARLWVANATDSTVVPIDASTGVPGQPTGVGAAPVAMAVDEQGLWVASEDGASISQLDPTSGVTLAAPIQLAARPSALTLDADSIWIAAADGTVTRIDRATDRVTATTEVGGALAAIALGGDSLWIGDQAGIVYRLDPANPSAPPTRISTSSGIAALATVGGKVWLAARASAASHRGGTLRIVQDSPYSPDPLDAGADQSAMALQADGLVGFRRVGGAAGAVLLPDLATSIPQPTDGGLTYTFRLRPGLVYSTGEPVRVADFRRAIERSFHLPSDPDQCCWGSVYFTSIVGTDACVNEAHAPATDCDLSAGIVTDDSAHTVTFHLKNPDPDFLYKLAVPPAYPVPASVPMDKFVQDVFPGTGPYVVSERSDGQVTMTRNARFEVWDAAVRPDGFPDEIVFTVVDDADKRVAMVTQGDADVMESSGVSPTASELFATKYPAQWHVGGVGTAFALMNTSIPPFDSLEARQAVNLAIDRGHMIDLHEGRLGAAVTCQLLPPGWPGYRPYCPYTVTADQGGRWSGPDLDAAQRLVDRSGTRGAKVVVGPTFGGLSDELAYLGSVLEGLGYDVSMDTETDFGKIVQTWAKGKTQITFNGWIPDWVGPSTFLALYTCDGEPTKVMNYCDGDYDKAYQHALGLQATDPAAAGTEWAALDRRGVDLALMAPLYNGGGWIVSSRVGNFQASPNGALLLDQMWVQ